MIAAMVYSARTTVTATAWTLGVIAGVLGSLTVIFAALRKVRHLPPAVWFVHRFIAPIGASWRADRDARQAERDARQLEELQKRITPITDALGVMRGENALQHAAVWKSIDGMSGRLTAVEEALTTPERRAS